jgi:hypothetical protein
VAECADFALPLPKLHVVTVNEVFGVFFAVSKPQTELMAHQYIGVSTT